MKPTTMYRMIFMNNFIYVQKQYQYISIYIDKMYDVIIVGGGKTREKTSNCICLVIKHT